MRIAFIDLGTNSVRFAVHEVGRGGRTERLHLDRIPLRLGESVFTTHHLSEEAIARTVEAFRSFKKQALALDATKVVSVATSALRDAKNSGDLLNAVRSETKIEVRIISGEEEARLIAQGVINNEKDLSGPVLVFDLGGGSTEFVLCENAAIIRTASLNLGALRMQQTFLKTIPPRQLESSMPHPVNAMRHHIRCLLSEKFILEGWPQPRRFIGASGTVRALVRIGKKNGDRNGGLERETLETLIKVMLPMNRQELLQIPGMEEKRTDNILAGAVLLEEIFDVFRAKKITSTEYSLRDGLVDHELALIRSIESLGK